MLAETCQPWMHAITSSLCLYQLQLIGAKVLATQEAVGLASGATWAGCREDQCNAAHATGNRVTETGRNIHIATNFIIIAT